MQTNAKKKYLKRKIMKIIKEELFAEKQAWWIKMNGRKPWKRGRNITETAIIKRIYEYIDTGDLTCEWLPVPGGKFDPNPAHTAQIYYLDTYSNSNH